MSARQSFQWSHSKVTLALVGVIFAAIATDQALKIWVKLTFPLYGGIDVCDWFKIYFIENKGMAFGMEMGSKLFLTIFRLIACGALIFYLRYLIRHSYRPAFIFTVGLVFAGAIGNLIDSVFYGVIFSHSFGQVADFLPASGGYAPWLQGKVVDMFFFPLITNNAGEVIFFNPVFNFADVCVTTSVFVLVIFFGKDLSHSLETKRERKKRHIDTRRKLLKKS